MSVVDYYKELNKEKSMKNKRHLDFKFENLSEDELVQRLVFIFESLNTCDIANVNFSISCDYWECGSLDEEKN